MCQSEIKIIIKKRISRESCGRAREIGEEEAAEHVKPKKEDKPGYLGTWLFRAERLNGSAEQLGGQGRDAASNQTPLMYWTSHVVDT